MRKVSEQDLSNIIKRSFNSNTILVNFKGIINGRIFMIKSNCYYNHKEGILYLFDLFNHIKIDIASQYKILFDEDRKELEIKLDNGQDLKLIKKQIK